MIGSVTALSSFSLEAWLWVCGPWPNSSVSAISRLLASFSSFFFFFFFSFLSSSLLLLLPARKIDNYGEGLHSFCERSIGLVVCDVMDSRDELFGV